MCDDVIFCVVKLLAALFAAFALAFGGQPCAHAHGAEAAVESMGSGDCHDMAPMHEGDGSAMRHAQDEGVGGDDDPAHPCPGGDDCPGCAMTSAVAAAPAVFVAPEFVDAVAPATPAARRGAFNAFDPPPPRG
ncbi:MAG: DUF2946 family protein [Pseudomonadota bacterium]